MGKHIKTQIDYDIIEQFAKEIKRIDPDNEILQKFAKMDNFEGSQVRKAIGMKI